MARAKVCEVLLNCSPKIEVDMMKKFSFSLMFVLMVALFSLITPLHAYADFSDAQCVMFRRAKILSDFKTSPIVYLVDGLTWTSSGIDQIIIYGGTYRYTSFPYGAFYDDCDPANPGWKTARIFWPPQEGIPAYTENFITQFEEEGQNADFLINYDDTWPVCAICTACDTSITNFTPPSEPINFYAGDTLPIAADYQGNAGNVNWTFTVDGAVITESTDLSIDFNWDGYIEGVLVTPGTHNGILRVENANDPNCYEEIPFTFEVEGCSLSITNFVPTEDPVEFYVGAGNKLPISADFESNMQNAIINWSLTVDGSVIDEYDTPPASYAYTWDGKSGYQQLAAGVYTGVLNVEDADYPDCNAQHNFTILVKDTKSCNLNVPWGSTAPSVLAITSG